MTARAPLLDRAAGDAVFRRVSGVVDAAGFVAHARGVAAGLPESSAGELAGGRFVANLCRDRYLFAVAFAAGLIAGRTALLNIEAAGLDAYPGCVVLRDADIERVVPVIGGDVPFVDCAHLAAIVFTSGSTGAPVPHEKRWGALVARSRAAIAPFGLMGGSVIGTVPPQHMYGFETTVLLPLHAPVCSWCGPTFFPGDVAAALLASPGPRLLVTTPLQLRALVQGLMQEGVQGGGQGGAQDGGRGGVLPMSGVISATAPLDPALAAEAEGAWGCAVREIFGATECGSIASRRTVEGPDWAPYPGVGIGFEDAGAVVSAPFMDDVVLADVLEPTGGGFRLLGRRTDVVKLGGRRASLPGLNQVLLAVEGVLDGAFVVPDDLDARSTARLLAVVVAPSRTGAAILAALRLVVDPVFLPRRVICVDRMPRNEMGKLPRGALLALLEGAA